MATLTAPSTGPAMPSTTTSSSSGLPPPHRSSSAPTSSSAPSIPSSSAPIEHVAECSYEFLLAEILQWVERDEKRIAMEAKRVQAKADEMNNGGGNGKFAFLGIGKCNLRGVGIDIGVALAVLLIFIDVDAAKMADGVDGCDTTIG